MADDAKGATPSDNDQWMMNVSHELRTPLLTVLGFPQLLVAFSTDPLKVTEYAGFIEQGAQRTLDLMNATLDLFKERPDGVTLADLDKRLSEVAMRPGHNWASAYSKDAPKGPQGTAGE